MDALTHKPRSLYITLSMLMVGIVLLLYTALALYQLEVGKRRMLVQAADTFERVGREMVAGIEAELRPARQVVSLLAQTALLQDGAPEQRLAQLPLLEAALRGNPSLSAVYGGTARGSFVLLRRVEGEAQRRVLGAPVAAAYVLQSVRREPGAEVQGDFLYLDAQLQPLERQRRPEYRFDPRERPWFTQALAAPSGTVVQTAPYLFFTTREVGLTLASAQSGAAAGVDVSLQTLGALLARQRITTSAEMMIVDGQGAVLAMLGPVQPGAERMPRADELRLPTVRELGSPVLLQLWEAHQAAPGALQPIQEIQGREWVARVEPLIDTPSHRLSLVVAAPRDELQADALRWRRVSLLITAGLVLLILPLVHWAARRVSQPLRQLAEQAVAIRRFDFSGPDPARSRILEVDQLAVAMGAMKQAQRRFLEISSALSGERQFDALLDRILAETMSVAEASSAAIHLLSPDGERLVPTALRLQGQPADPRLLTEWSMQDEHSPAVTVQALRQGRLLERLLQGDDLRDLGAYAPVFRQLGASSLRLVALPLRNRQDELIGALSLGFADAAAEPGLSPSRSAFIEALAGPAAVAIDNQQLLKGQKALLESLIQLVAGAIDAKSPYTGGHCQRVPEITKALAQAACDATEGPFADFQMSPERWEALHIAAWLHDCGKVTTPEYVVDKATKLETLYNRIHEIRMRFELLKQQADVEQLEAALVQAGGSPAAAHAAALPQQRQLDEEFAFVAACNEGGEFLGPEQQARLRQIGARRWWRTLDDRLGCSQAELRRLARRPEQALPVQEALLADKPEHRIERAARDRLAADNRWGFTLAQPELAADLGELHNLGISRGTLTEEERYTINDHIVQTIKMLTELPFPRHLREVPEIAAGHHERMDGGGYPRGLRGEQMSPEARMMAIADVFEALTADDRPYKKGKRLSEALKIMAGMARDGHLDADLLRLFLESGVCLDYARRTLNPEQLDVQVLSPYLP